MREESLKLRLKRQEKISNRYPDRLLQTKNRSKQYQILDSWWEEDFFDNLFPRGLEIEARFKFDITFKRE
jgi:hypothetical protein